MRFRLALLYSIVIGIVILALSIFVYSAMSRHTENVLKSSLIAEAEHVSTLMTAADIPRHEPHLFSVPPLDTFENREVMIQILDVSGTLLARSDKLNQTGIPLDSNALKLASQGTPGFYWTMIENSNYLVGLFPVQQSLGKPVGIVLAAANEKDRSRTLSTLLYMLIAGGAGSIALVWLMGWVTASTALKPVREAIDTARAIALSKSFSRKLTFSNARDELGQMIAAFNEMLSSLEASQAMQQRFIADASHELRAPLTIIRGNLDLLERARDKPPEEQAEILYAARAEVERMTRLVADLLSLSRADSRIAMENTGVELDSLVVEVFQQLRVRSTTLNLRLSHVEPVLVSGDRERLNQLIMILSDNALRYTPAGGSITLSLVREEPWVVFAVADTGIGIEPRDLPYIFERFYRSERAREMDPGGTGLGLAIARWIVVSHGGEIKLESQQGKGTIAVAKLPLLR